MITLRQIRIFIHGLCLSGAMMGLAGDVVLNPRLYGEHLSWTGRSTVIAALAFVVWLLALGITRWVERMNCESRS